MINKPYLHIYTDGGYVAKNDIGGWGVVITEHIDNRQNTHHYSGHQRQTSSLEMELTAAVRGLEQIIEIRQRQQPETNGKLPNITLYTDSKILLEGLEGKIERYRQQNWVHKSGRPVASRSLWERLQELIQALNVHVKWVKGHSRHEGNLQADALARSAIQQS